MATTQELIKDVNTEVAALNEMTTNRGLQQIPTLKPISPTDLQGDVPVANVPSPATASPEAGALAKIEADTKITQSQAETEAEQFTQDLQEKSDSLEKFFKQDRAAYIDSFLNAPTFSEVQAEVYNAEGVDVLKREVAKATSQLISEQDALRTKIENIQRNGGGLKAGAQAEIANAERDSLAKQADIALKKMALQGDYEFAKETSDRYVNAMFERQEREIDARKFIFEENKELFTQAEQRLFQTKLGDRERKLEWEKTQEKLLQSTKLDAIKMAQTNGAPAEVTGAIAKARTPEEVLIAGGRWGSTDMLERMYRQAQIDNIYNTINDRAAKKREAATTAKEEKEAGVEQSLGIRELAKSLLTVDAEGNVVGLTDGGASAVGFGLGKTVMSKIPFVDGTAVKGSDRADFEAQAKRLANMLTLDNLDLMSGVLSETDIKILESAGSNLGNFDISEEAYLKEVKRIYDVSQRVINDGGLTDEQASFWGIVDNTDMEDINSIWE